MEIDKVTQDKLDQAELEYNQMKKDYRKLIIHEIIKIILSVGVGIAIGFTIAYAIIIK